MPFLSGIPFLFSPPHIRGRFIPLTTPEFIKLYIAFYPLLCYPHFTDIGGVLAAVSSLPQGISFSACSISEHIPDNEYVTIVFVSVCRVYEGKECFVWQMIPLT